VVKPNYPQADMDRIKELAYNLGFLSKLKTIRLLPEGAGRKDMRNTLALLAAIAVLVLALGYFLGWYDLVGVESNGAGHRLQIDVNTNKIKSDIDKGATKIKETIREFQEAGEEGGPTKTPDLPKERDPAFRF
jgi:hypothetical protein